MLCWTGHSFRVIVSQAANDAAPQRADECPISTARASTRYNCDKPAPLVPRVAAQGTAFWLRAPAQEPREYHVSGRKQFQYVRNPRDLGAGAVRVRLLHRAIPARSSQVARHIS